MFTMQRQARLLLPILLAMAIAAVLCIPTLTDHSYAAAKPAKVSGVKVSLETTTTYAVKWNKAKNAKFYQVQYKKASAKKWSSDTTSDRLYQISDLTAGAKYQIRVRGVNGSRYGSWSSVITKKKKAGPASPFAYWPKKITIGTLSYAWYPAPGAEYYIATCKDHTTLMGTEKTEDCEATFDDLYESIGYQITIFAYKGSVRSDDCIYIETGTMSYDNDYGYGEDLKLELRDPTSVYYTMTLFQQHMSGQLAGDEWSYPVLYSEGEEGHESDTGFFFVKHMDIDCALINHGTLRQYGAEDQKITDPLTLKVGDTFTDPKGNTVTINGLRLQTYENDDAVRDCSEPREAFDHIEYFELTIDTGEANPPFIQWEMFD